MLEIKNGKLYKDNVVIILEIGNPEHIRIYKQANEQLLEALNLETDEGIELEIYLEDVVYTIGRAKFKCKCGAKIDISKEMDGEKDEDDFIDEIEDTRKTCYKCQARYFLFKKDDCLKVRLDKQ